MYERIEEDIKSNVDWLTLVLYLALVLAGWASIYGASYQYENAVSMFDISGRAGMQLVWIGISLVVGFILLKLDSNVYDIFAYYIYIGMILLLAVTVAVATEIRGSRSWLVITDSIRLQPAEFTKFAVALTLAKFMSSYNFKLMTVKSLSIIAGLIALPMCLIFLQNETGSALVYVVFVLVLYREGLPGIILALGVTLIALFVIGLKYSEADMGIITEGEFISIILILLISSIFLIVYKNDGAGTRNIILGMAALFGLTYLINHYAGDIIDWGIVGLIAVAAVIVYLLVLAKKYWSKVYTLTVAFIVFCMAFTASTTYLFDDVLQPHQQMRIKVAFGMEDDLMGAGYNVNQSKIAIGSGGFMGKGFLNGTQTKLKYVPEQDTDFIFCTVGEEQGFVGSVAVLCLFLTLIFRLIFLSERQKNTFGRVYGYSVACIFLFHIAINVGMVTGLTPVIGIPLPFFSYGGSSLLAFSILLFIFLRIDMARKRR